MAYEGWFTFGGTEIINGPRTAAYIRGLLPSMRVKDVCADECSCDHLAAFLGDNPYASPLADDAPWVDPARPESYEFLGCYPVDVENLTDGTTVATTLDSLTDGGWVTTRRDGIRDVLFTVALFSTTEAGDDYGVTWLKAALEGACEGSGCVNTTQLCFLSACVDPETFSGRLVTTEHRLADWRLFKSKWTSRTINLEQQDSWAELEVLGSCGEVEWELTIRGEAGNHMVLRHDGGEDLILLDGSAQTVRVTTAGTRIQVAIPDVSDYASWGEATDPGALADYAHFTDTTSAVPGGAQAAWTQFTTIPLPVEIIQVVSNARVETTDDECAAEFMRYLRRVSHTDGPRTRRKEVTSDGGILRTMDFVLTAEKPAVFTEPVLVAKGAGNSLVPMAVPYRTLRLQENINDCVQSPVKQVLDPLGKIVPPPPPPSLSYSPDIEPLPPSKNPYAVLIPASTIPMWLNAVPIVKITAGKKDVRGVRVRFFPVPLESYLPSDIDPCSACGSFQIEYIPAGAQFTFDGTEERGTISVGGIEQSAEHLLAGDGGVGGISWPELSCGISYMVLIDSREQELSDVEILMAVRS